MVGFVRCKFSMTENPMFETDFMKEEENIGLES
jgi:hypothetical protein